MLNCIIATTLAEFGHEAAEHAGLVHAPQRRLRIDLRAQDLEEDAVGFRIAPQLVVDQAQRAAQQPDGVGMEEGAGALGLREEADQVDRIALEDVGVGDVEPAVVDAEIAASRGCWRRVRQLSGLKQLR